MHIVDTAIIAAEIGCLLSADATERELISERIAALVEDFQKLDFDRQQHLLFIARALVDDASREASR
jgi:hypothetical protein